MSSLRPFAWLAALLAALGVATSAQAQHFQPFIDPGYFEPDLQFFAPAEVSEFGCGEPPNTGVYFDYGVRELLEASSHLTLNALIARVDVTVGL